MLAMNIKEVKKRVQEGVCVPHAFSCGKEQCAAKRKSGAAGLAVVKALHKKSKGK